MELIYKKIHIPGVVSGTSWYEQRPKDNKEINITFSIPSAIVSEIPLHSSADDWKQIVNVAELAVIKFLTEENKKRQLARQLVELARHK